MSQPKVIRLSPYGESQITVDFVSMVLNITTKYNYSAECWMMDLSDSLGEAVISGIMLVPFVDLLYPYAALQEEIGSLYLIEKTQDAYKDPNLLGVDTLLVWFPTDTETTFDELFPGIAG